MTQPSFTDYCAEMVRTGDRDLWLVSLCMPRAARPALWAVMAFHLELQRIPHVVSNPILGRIRLQWWREAIERLYVGKPDSHEIIRALEYALQNGVLWQESDLQVMIETYDDVFISNGSQPVDLTKLYDVLLHLLCQAAKTDGQPDDLAAVAHAYALSKTDGQHRTVQPIKRTALPRVLQLFNYLARRKNPQQVDHLLGLKLWLFA